MEIFRALNLGKTISAILKPTQCNDDHATLEDLENARIIGTFKGTTSLVLSKLAQNVKARESVTSSASTIEERESPLENNPVVREYYILKIQKELLEVVKTIFRASNNNANFNSSDAGFAVKAYLGPSIFHIKFNTGESRFMQILQDLLDILEKQWQFDGNLYHDKNEPFYVSNAQRRPSLRVFKTMEESSLLALANYHKQIMAISLDALHISGDLDPLFGKDIAVLMPTTTLDEMFIGATATILHELCHLIDPKIVDIKLKIRDLPRRFKRSRLRGISGDGRSCSVYSNYACRVLCEVSPERAHLNGENVMRAILTAYLQIQLPHVQVVSPNMNVDYLQLR